MIFTKKFRGIKKNNIKLVTFGSCMSRYVANNYIRLFGGRLISSVYHNRSDYFYKKFISKEWEEYDFEEIRKELGGDKGSNPDEKSSIILSNQFSHGVGKHRLSKGINFFEALTKKPDILIMDNYMDLAGRLVKRNIDNENEGVFLRLRDFSKEGAWETGEYIEINKAVGYMNKIVRYIREASPSTNIIFVNFPHTTYEENKKRVDRHVKYEELFSNDDVYIFKCMHVDKAYRTKDKQHYAPAFYAGYAGQIYARLDMSS